MNHCHLKAYTYMSGTHKSHLFNTLLLMPPGGQNLSKWK